MGLYKRKNSPFWWMSFRHEGRRVRESTAMESRKLAERLYAKRLTEISEGRLRGPLNRTADGSTLFSELADKYLVWAERQKAYRGKKSKVKMLVAHFGGLRLKAFSTGLVEEYQTKVLREKIVFKDKDKVPRLKTPATANRHVAILKHIFSKAVEWELVDDSVLKRVRKVKLLPENNRRLRFLSREECAALVSACDPHLKPIVVTALNTGMRKEEILSLEWERHVDLRHGFILLDVTKNGERREVPINLTLRSTLQSLIRRLDSPFVFTDRKGGRFLNVMRSFLSACRRAGIRGFRFHDLRYTFASQLVMAGVDLTTVKELLGHKTLTMTLRYAHLAPSHKVKAVETLDVGHTVVTLGEKGLKEVS